MVGPLQAGEPRPGALGPRIRVEAWQSVLAKLGPGQDALATDTPATLACSEGCRPRPRRGGGLQVGRPSGQVQTESEPHWPGSRGKTMGGLGEALSPGRGGLLF